MNRYSRLIASMPQSLPVPGENMVPNQAGGYAFQADRWQRLERFLILGSETNTYYVSEEKVAGQNIDSLLDCIRADGLRVVGMILDARGRAFRTSSCIFALAACYTHGNLETRRAVALSARGVLWTASQLFEFIDTVRRAGRRGFGRVMRSLVQNWYGDFEVQDLAYQMVKYRTRNGYSHRDLLRLAHVKPATEMHERLFRWAVRGEYSMNLPDVVRGFAILNDMHSNMTPEDVAATILRYNLPREAVPTALLDTPQVWDALFGKMPIIATLRNLNKMTKVGLFEHRMYLELLRDKLSPENLQRATINPLSILMALMTYRMGRGVKGDLRWTPNSEVDSILSQAFSDAYGSVERIDKNVLIAIDVSGSMNGAQAATGVNAMSAAMALALVLDRNFTHPNMVLFDTSVRTTPLFTDRRGHDSIEDVLRLSSGWHGGGTDIGAPIRYALEDRQTVYDGIITITDMETWAGNKHAHWLMRDYRQHRNPNAVGINIMTAATQTSALPHNSALDYEVVGFSSEVPQVIQYAMTR